MPAPTQKAWATRPWDVLALALVIVPLVTGGAWIRRPGLNVELSELGIPVLVFAAITALVHRWIDPKQSSVLLTVQKIWAHWQARGVRSVIAGSFVMGALYSAASLRRHWAFASNAADLGIFQGALWNLTHGYGLVSPVKGGILLFRDHLSPILYAIAPLFALFPRPETLLIVQGFGIALGAIPLYFLARQHSQSATIALAAPLLYWLYLPTRNGNAFDFHPETLMLPIGLWFIFAAQKGSWLSLPSFLLLLAGKESSGPLLAGLGVAWALGAAPHGRRKLGLALAAFGCVWFWWETRWIPTHWLAQNYVYDAAYAGFEPGLKGILLAPFQHPLVFLERLLGPARLRFLFWTLGGLAFLPLLSWRTALAAVPCYLILFLASGDHRLSLYYYYAIEPSVALFWALPAGWEMALARFGRTRLTVWIAFWALALSGRSELYRIRNYAPDAHARWLAREFVPCVDHSVPLSATGSLLPHLAERPWAVALPATASCVISDPGIDTYPLSKAQAREVPAALIAQGFQVAYQCGEVQVLSQNTRCMECNPTCVLP